MKKRISYIIGIATILLFLAGIKIHSSQQPLAQEIPTVVSPMKDTKNTEAIDEREFRATWISTVYNLDWPSKKGLSKEKQQEEFIVLLDELKSTGLNAVIVQIKPAADSFYPSEYSPWSEYLTGIQGKDPGYDPLDFMIKATHQRDMEFHAWFNPYRVSVKDDISELTADHPAIKNPSWVVSYGGKLYYNPGILEVRKFVVNSIMEVVKNYDIDGVHLDDYFYPYPVKDLDFPDEDLYRASKKNSIETKEEWRRNNINEFIEDLYTSIKSEKRHVKFGISPFAVWRNQDTDSLGSQTKASVTSYDSLYADTKLWVEKGWLDYIAPQIYWYFGYSPAPYEVVLKWWTDLIQDKDIHLYVGHATYKVQSGDDPWGNPYEILNQINYNRNTQNVKGSIFFRTKSLVDNPLNLKENLKTTLYKEPALVPEMPWLKEIEEVME